MDFQFNNISSINIENIYNVFSYESNPENKESIQIPSLLNNEEHQSNFDNFSLNNNRNVEEDANDNMEENAAPHISGNMENLNGDNEWLEDSQSHDFFNFSILNSSNIFDIKQEPKDSEFTNINADKIDENVGKEKINICEKKEIHFQMEDFVTPSGDNDNMDNTNNKNLNSINGSKKINLESSGNNHLSNSSSSQNTKKSSVLSISLSNNTPLNNSTNQKAEIICATFCPKIETNEDANSNPTPKKKKTKRPKAKKKYKLEGIRKKIKSRLHKRLKCNLNKKLTNCGSKMLFEFFPQSFITDVSVIKNKAYLNLSMRQLLMMTFGTRAKDKEKVNINKKVLNYLDSNSEVRIKSGADKFLNSLYRDIINEYINGKLFEEDVDKLKKEKKSKEYIEKYIYVAKHLVEFFEKGKIPKTQES